MGGSKRELEEREYYEELACKALVACGAMKQCEIHGYYFNSDPWDESLYGKSTNWLKKQYPNAINFKLFHEMLAEVSNEYCLCETCFACDKIAKE
ncbi:MAG: hypothetical protein PHQ62_00065 [Clostridia bacterium]|nr:hypothetical protein [Clostridia bacterium]